jgi:hypothetical protein
LVVFVGFIACLLLPHSSAFSETPSSEEKANSLAIKTRPSLPGAHPDVPFVLVQSTEGHTDADAESSATPTANSTGSADNAESVSSASEYDENAPKDAAYCLKCHGPFEKLSERTQDYVTEFDENINPHIFVPHKTTEIVDCMQCHEPHPIPLQDVKDVTRPTLDFCYTCHHTQTFAACTDCHNE